MVHYTFVKTFTPIYGKRDEVQAQIGTQLYLGEMTPLYTTLKPRDDAIIGYAIVDIKDNVYYIRSGEDNYSTDISVTWRWSPDEDEDEDEDDCQETRHNATMDHITTALDDTTRTVDEDAYIKTDDNGFVQTIDVWRPTY